jgi:hypothetical protein
VNQKLSDWASIAEIVSGTAVVVTLVFLILGIRENTAVTRASMYQRSTEQILDWRNQTINDPEIARLFQAFLAGDNEGINGISELRQIQLMANIFQIYEQAYFAEQYGVMGPSEWSRFETQICSYHDLAQASPVITDTVYGLMTQEFVTYMREQCRQ